MDLLKECTVESFCPPQRLGPFVCVPVIEASSYPKARLMAARECFKCVEQIGLSGIGKKGTLAAANALSQEKMMENRTAYLDLLELLLSRMNGDMQRFVRICGSSLSGKARDMLEERVKKGGKTPTIAAGSSAIGEPTKRSSSSFAQQRASPFKNQFSPNRTPLKSISDDYKESGLNSSFGDELPALGLRNTPTGIPKPGSSRPTMASPSEHWSNTAINSESASNILSNLLDAEEMLEESSSRSQNTETGPMSNSGMNLQSEPFLPSTRGNDKANRFSSSMSATGSDIGSDIGAAASLRARLLKIREKNKGTSFDESPVKNSAPPASNNLLRETQNKPSTFESFSKESAHIVGEADDVENGGIKQPVSVSDENVSQSAEEKLNDSLDTLSFLLSKAIPLQEDDIDIFAATDVLKTIHAAVSGQANLAVNMSPEEVTSLRVEIKYRSNEVVAALTRLIDFGFNCHEPNCSAGMSVPLLSVNLASLMAIFRSEDLATQVVVDDLTVLVREAGKALLDRRLSSSSSASDTFKLDDATSTQMVRAINKVCTVSFL